MSAATPNFLQVFMLLTWLNLFCLSQPYAIHEALFEIPVTDDRTSQYEKPDKEAVIGSLEGSKGGPFKTNV